MKSCRDDKTALTQYDSQAEERGVLTAASQWFFSECNGSMNVMGLAGDAKKP